MRRSHLLFVAVSVLLIPGVEGASAADSTASLLCFLFGDKNAPAQARQKTDKTPPQNNASPGWTLEEALSQLALQPNDSYLQYVALQLARRQKKVEETVQKIQEIQGDQIWSSERFEGVDLFSIFSGALAVQESLQLDAMQGHAPRGRRPQQEAAGQPNPAGQNQSQDDGEIRAKRRTELVPLSDLQGPTIKSHPWKEMLLAKTKTSSRSQGTPDGRSETRNAREVPRVGRLSRCVPEDFYYVEFRSVTRLLDTLETTGLWSTHVFNQALQDARSSDTSTRVQKQLALETTPDLRPFFDLAVDEVAITGSDLYVREGSDITVIFRVKQSEMFRPHMDGMLGRAEKSRPDLRRSTGRYLDVEFVHLETPDRAVCVYSAYPAGDLHVRSNSRVAFERVLETILGRSTSGRPVRGLGNSDEYAYIRTLMPRGAKAEDGFIYLSDPFIRRQVGPQVKLTERRRAICYNHLRMISHAALLYHTEKGRWPDSLQTLISAKCCPYFKIAQFSPTADLFCPDGGNYTLSPDGTHGICSRHGHAHFLTPGCELPLTKVNGEEADEYRSFLQEYNQYWRTYFDPIAIRIQTNPDRYRVETIVLPLINNSIYKSLAETLGGKPEPFDAPPILGKTICSLSLRLNKERLVKEMENQFRQEAEQGPETFASWFALTADGRYPATLPWIGLLAGAQQKEDPAINVSDLHLAISKEDLEKLKLSDFRNLVTRGLGNQIDLHFCDAPPLFDFNTALAFGGPFGIVGSDASESALSIILYSSLINLLNTPFYLAIPVQDARVVDDFLNRLDVFWAAAARIRNTRWPVQYEFFKFNSQQDPKIIFRGNALRFGPIKGRLFSARIGNVFYLTSKPHTLLEDLVAAHRQAHDQAKTADHQRIRLPGEAGHARIRVYPENWNQVLTDYRLGWADNNREACLNNLGPLSSVARAFTAPQTKLEEKELEALCQCACRHADQLHGVHFSCPEGGSYRLVGDGKTMTCSVHGSILAPRQPTVPSKQSGLGKLMKHFKGMTTAITFTEDGLRAVMTIERR
jgi:hypothetical protein